MPYFKTQDETRPYYRDHGERPPVLFLASQGLSSHMWQRLIAALTDRGSPAVASAGKL